MKDKLKDIVIVFISVLAALGLGLEAGPVFANEGHGTLEVAFSSSPRFPVAGEEAVLTFKISSNGTPEAGQEVMVMLAKTASGGHGHGPAPADAGNASGAMPTDMPGMDMGGAQATETSPAIMLMPDEISPGVYVAKYTFEQGGRYVATVQIGDEESDVVVPVRSGPIAWPYIIGLAGISALLAGVVAVVKTVRKEW